MRKIVHILGVGALACAGGWSCVATWQHDLALDSHYRLVEHDRQARLSADGGLTSLDQPGATFATPLWMGKITSRIVLADPAGAEHFNEELDRYLARRVILAFCGLGNNRFACLTRAGCATPGFDPRHLELVTFDYDHLLDRLDLQLQHAEVAMDMVRRREMLILTATALAPATDGVKTMMLTPALAVIRYDKTFFRLADRPAAPDTK